ncbi:MAG: hypothetical protein ACTS10_05180 [Kiloniellales bacterium]
MATYSVRMMDAETGGEGLYRFDGPEDLFARTPVKIVKAFMDYVDKTELPHEHIEYEINAAFKNGEHKTVTAMGHLILKHLPPIPFMMMISPNGGS